MEDLIEEPDTLGSGDSMVEIDQDVNGFQEELEIKLRGDDCLIFVDHCEPGGD